MSTDFLFTRTRTPQAASAGAAGYDPWEPPLPEDPFPAPRPFDHGGYASTRHRAAGCGSRQRAGRSLAVAVAAAVLFVALCAFVAMAAVTLSDAAAGAFADQGLPWTAAEAASTPRDQWRRGTVPTLYQTDGEWADVPYGGGTIGTHGCGPTALSMAYVGLTGNVDRDPAAMAAFAQEGGFLDDGITSWLLMSAGANELGLSSQVLGANEDAVREALLADHPVICSVGPGDFTTEGHFIVLVDANADGTVSLRDPNSPERTAQTWDLGRVLGQCLNLWELSR